MQPTFPSKFNPHGRQSASAQAPEPGRLRDAWGTTWSPADLATAAERAAAYLARQVLPAFDPSDPRATG